MEHAFSIISICVAIGILALAALIATGGFDFLPKRHFAAVYNKKKSAHRFALVLCMVAAAPLIAGGLGFILQTWMAAGILIVLLIFAIYLGKKMIDK